MFFILSSLVNVYLIRINLLFVVHLSVPEQSRRSSLSEASGISGTSTRTYVNEASTLVLETLENGIKK